MVGRMRELRDNRRYAERVRRGRIVYATGASCTASAVDPFADDLRRVLADQGRTIAPPGPGATAGSGAAAVPIANLRNGARRSQ
jgi:hypothetical protein